MIVLTTDQALTIARETLAEGKRLGLAPLTCAVLDKGGHLLALLRDDAASLYRPEIAIGKASSCLGMGFGGRELARRADLMPMFFNSLQATFPNGMFPVAGGVLLRDDAGALLGAAGVSGDTSDNDEIALLAGVAAAGLSAQTGA